MAGDDVRQAACKLISCRCSLELCPLLSAQMLMYRDLAGCPKDTKDMRLRSVYCGSLYSANVAEESVDFLC